MQNSIADHTETRQRIGLIQSRGLGDIIIALPIAKWYHQLGYRVLWPIDEKFHSSFKNTIDYVDFIPFKFEATLAGFYTNPLKILHENKCVKIITLYSYLSKFPIHRIDLYASLTFDQYKYAISNVPFEEKWHLIIRRNKNREDNLFNKLVDQENYIVIQEQGSNFKSNPIIPNEFKNYKKIYINESTDSIFDWLKVIENAKSVFLIDSCFANLVEQLNLKIDKYFIFRSQCNFTPIMKSQWKFINST